MKAATRATCTDDRFIRFSCRGKRLTRIHAHRTCRILMPQSATPTQLSPLEHIKADSRFLRGTIDRGLSDRTTGAISEPDTKLLKFHGSYQQDNRDVRDERRR